MSSVLGRCGVATLSATKGKLIAAIHRDWGEAQGNYDELRFFTGLRPSEQIALAVRHHFVNGVISINKSWVCGVGRWKTKTSEEAPVRGIPTRKAIGLQKIVGFKEFGWGARDRTWEWRDQNK